MGQFLVRFQELSDFKNHKSPTQQTKFSIYLPKWQTKKIVHVLIEKSNMHSFIERFLKYYNVLFFKKNILYIYIFTEIVDYQL